MGGHQDCRSTKRIRIRNRKAGRTGRRISQVGRPRGGREKNRGSSEVAKGRRREITKGSSQITEITKGNSEIEKGRKREITKGRRGGSKEKGLRSPKRKRRQRERGTTEKRKGVEKEKEGMEAKLNADITKLRKQNKESELKVKEREDAHTKNEENRRSKQEFFRKQQEEEDANECIRKA